MMPVMPVHAGLFDGFLGWLQNTFSSFKQKRSKQKQATQGSAVSESELNHISNQVMPTYGTYDRSNKCWGKRCMSVNFANRIENRGDTLYYLLTSDESADNYDMYVLRRNQSTYQIISKQTYKGLGFSGDGMFVQMGKDVYGWNIMTGDKSGAALYEDFYAVIDGKIRHVASIQDFLRSAPSNNTTILTGDIQFGRGNEAMFPLDVTVSGTTGAKLSCGSCEPQGGARFPKKVYRFQYDSQTGRYQMPVDYPMKGQRF